MNNTNASGSMSLLADPGWAEKPTSTAPALAGDVSCEVAVVGGGLGGMAAALRLADLGRDVVLLESGVCGWGASARNAGYISGTLGSDPRIVSRFYRDRASGLYRFANTSVSFLEELIADRAIGCDYEATGVFAAEPTAAGFRRVRKTTKSSRRATVASAEEAGVPPGFNGGVHVKIGGVHNPALLALGLRDIVRAAGVRVYEQTAVRNVSDSGASVTIDTPGGRVTADRAILATNAFMNDLDIAPRHLSTPVWVTAVETEPVPGDRLDAAGWTSRLPIVTNHLVMQSFRTTKRGSIVFTTRNLEMDRRPSSDRVPSEAVARDLVRGFHNRFPTLRDIAPARAWGGWIGMTPANIAVAGRATDRVFYTMACNGHGVPHAPYLGTLLAEHVGGAEMHEDLRVLWREKPRFAIGIVNPLTIRLGWVADRLTDRYGRIRK